MDAAKARIESLNPLVAVETITSLSALEPEEFDALVSSVDLVCITDSERDFLVSGRPPDCVRSEGLRGVRAQLRANDACRKAGTPLYTGGTYGLLGYIFCDLLEHEYITPYVSLLWVV